MLRRRAAAKREKKLYEIVDEAAYVVVCCGWAEGSGSSLPCHRFLFSWSAQEIDDEAAYCLG